MKDDATPVSPDEVVVRLIWTDFHKPAATPPVRDRAFLPRPNDETGISVFRVACLPDARNALAAIAPEKRDKYALALLHMAELTAIGLTVEPAKIDTVPGHAVIPELNAALATTDPQKCLDVQKKLAVLAAKNLIPPAGETTS